MRPLRRFKEAAVLAAATLRSEVSASGVDMRKNSFLPRESHALGPGLAVAAKLREKAKGGGAVVGKREEPQQGLWALVLDHVLHARRAVLLDAELDALEGDGNCLVSGGEGRDDRSLLGLHELWGGLLLLLEPVDEDQQELREVLHCSRGQLR